MKETGTVVRGRLLIQHYKDDRSIRDKPERVLPVGESGLRQQMGTAVTKDLHRHPLVVPWVRMELLKRYRFTVPPTGL